jgi:hypothetical protein
MSSASVVAACSSTMRRRSDSSTQGPKNQSMRASVVSSPVGMKWKST